MDVLSSSPGGGPKVLFKMTENKKWDFKREKNNTTSSLYIKDTILAPDVDEVLRCVSVAILYHFKKQEKREGPPKLLDIFDETIHPLTNIPIDTTQPPDAAAIYRFISGIFRLQVFCAEIGVLCLAYIERLITATGISFHPTNWRRIVVGAIVIASKVWEEEAVWNADFLDLLPRSSVNDLALLERRWLELLDFNVSVKASQYVKYYFELRSLSTLDKDHFPLEPLSKEAAAALEEKSIEREQKVRNMRRRSQSTDAFKPKTRHVLQ